MGETETATGRSSLNSQTPQASILDIKKGTADNDDATLTENDSDIQAKIEEEQTEVDAEDDGEYPGGFKLAMIVVALSLSIFLVRYSCQFAV
jgi:hypothetical protein